MTILRCTHMLIRTGTNTKSIKQEKKRKRKCCCMPSQYYQMVSGGYKVNISVISTVQFIAGCAIDFDPIRWCRSCFLKTSRDRNCLMSMGILFHVLAPCILKQNFRTLSLAQGTWRSLDWRVSWSCKVFFSKKLLNTCGVIQFKHWYMNMAVMYWLLSFTDNSLMANIRGSVCALNGAQLILRTNFFWTSIRLFRFVW